MIITETLHTRRGAIEAVCVTLQSKNFIVLRGAKGYVMCGYLNMDAANKFNDVAVKITGVASIEDALKTTAAEVSIAAAAMGIKVGQPVKEILELIA
jgi:uncharacterized protein YunC (DUF1805 family)